MISGHNLRFRPILTLILGGGLALSAQSVQAEGRLAVYGYDEHVVYRLEACRNFQTTISLASDEHVENVGLGDASAWQVLPNKRGDLLFVKPLLPDAFSNMSVVTDKRSYEFELKMAPEADCRRGHVIYHLRFSYPKPPPPPAAPDKTSAHGPDAVVPEKHNSAYTYAGARELVPFRIFDDGKSTFLKFNDQVSTPAIYVIGPDNTEGLINYSTRGEYFVLEQVARAIVLKRGGLVTTIYNDGYQAQGLDEASPQPRDADTGLFGHKKPKPPKPAPVITPGAHP